MPRTTRPAQSHAPKQGVQARRVLIVDDNADSAESMRLMFRMAGLEVRAVGEGASAAAAALDFRPHAIVLDIGLPDMDGHSVARSLRKMRELDDTVIVAVTGYGRDEDVRKSRDAGIDEHLTKPIDSERLLEIIGAGRRGHA